MIEESTSTTKMDYTSAGSFERPERCCICDNEIPVGSRILREKRIKHPICSDCAIEIAKIV